MPWVSSKQRKACFASKGFGGKLDCKKIGSHKAKSYTKNVTSPKNKKR